MNLEEVANNVRDVIANIEAVEGKAFRNGVQFAISVRTLIGLISAHLPNEHAGPVMFVMEHMTDHVLDQCLGLPDEKAIEVLKFASQISHNVEHHTSQMRQE